MSISAQDVAELRRRTNVGMMACKKALEEAHGDMEAAIELLRKRGESKAAEKSDRSTGEGCIAISGRAMVKILCETDFVAKNEDFVSFLQEVTGIAAKDGIDAAKAYFESVKTDKIQAIGENLVLGDVVVVEGGNTVAGYVHSNGKVAALVSLDGGSEDQAKDVAMHATAMNPSVANPEQVPAESIEKEKAIYRDQLKNEGKPEAIWDKIIVGKVNKFCAEQALTSQPFVKDPSQTVQAYLGDAKVVNFVRMAV
ncbi:MAG TPA: translation elongation factor Ts [Candidatus Gracilibacteria bacterium]